TITAAASGLTNGTDTIEVAPPVATNIVLAVTETAITSGESIQIMVTAADAGGTTITNFAGVVNLSASSGSVSPDTITIATAGTATGSFTLSGVTTDETVTITGAISGLTSGTDTVSVTGTPIVATMLDLQVTNPLKEVDNGTTVNVTISAIDGFGNIQPDFTGSITLAASGTATLDGTSQITVELIAAGTVSDGAIINIPLLTDDAIVDLTATFGGLTDGTDSVNVIFVPQGTSLLNSDFASGWNPIGAGTYYIASKNPTDPQIAVGGDIIVNAGVKLVIYPGATLNMGTNNMFINGGELEIIGTDADRVKLTSSSTWGGITVEGDSIGTGIVTIDGAYFDKLSGSAFYLGSGASSISGPMTVSNSRIHIDASTNSAVKLKYMKSGAHTFNNNVIVFTATNFYAFEAMSSLSTGITINIISNTIIGKGSSGSSAIYTPDSNANIYNIERNLIAGGFSWAITQGGTTPVHNIVNNFMRTVSHWDGNLSGGIWDTFTDNLYVATDGDPFNFTATWDTSQIFANYGSNDFNLLFTSNFPSSTQASGIASMVGALSSGHVNEVGGYGNGGYPPNFDE
ncbi:MAG: hypothetical protein HN368_05440, partial [Spirochaetales bacterium]|nr:hypothetical protein [Spirochaetales bacterium]